MSQCPVHLCQTVGQNLCMAVYRICKYNYYYDDDDVGVAFNFLIYFQFQTMFHLYRGSSQAPFFLHNPPNFAIL